MFKIGDFSKFSRVSVKMLRNYAARGLLSPHWVDPQSGYRYYTADQLPRLNRILILRDLGFSLEQVGTLLDGALSDDELRGMLRLRQAEIGQRLDAEQRRWQAVARQLEQLDDADQRPALDVVLRPLPAQRVASLRRTVKPDSGAVTQMFEDLERVVARFNARAPLPPLMLHHDAEYREDQRDVEVVLPLSQSLPESSLVTERLLSAVETAACVICTGRYTHLPEAFQALLHWIGQHQLQPAGPLRECYLRFGADNQGYTLPDAFLAQDSTQFVTELQLPVTHVS